MVEILVFGVNPLAYPSVAADSTWLQNLSAASDYVLLAMLFTTMRRRNGFAAIHDLVTKTRVVSRTALQVRPASTQGEATPPAVEAKPLIGPYHILDTIEGSADTAWLLGYDLRLLRKVWIRTVPAGSAPVPAALRNLGRVGRLRWLAGRRSPEENWDAFEAVTGQPLLQLLRERRQNTDGKGTGPDSNPQPWAQVRFWLCDLAAELSAAQKDRTLPPLLALDRVWITGDGRAKLLDFPAPGFSGPAADATSPPLLPIGDAPGFLGQIATVALEGRAGAAAKPPGEVSVPLPLHVRQFLKSLPQLVGVEAFLLSLRPLLQRVPVVTRRRRAAMLAGCIAFPLVMVAATVCGRDLMTQWNHHNPDVAQLMQVLELRAGMKNTDTNQFPVPTDRQFAIYIASHYHEVITNNPLWSSTLARVLIRDEGRRFAGESVIQYPDPTESELTEANAALMASQACSTPCSSCPASDIKDLSAIVNRLRNQSDPISTFLWQGLSNQDQVVLTGYQAAASNAIQSRQVVAMVLCHAMTDTNFYQAERFKGIALGTETIALLQHPPTNLNRAFLNRLLLDDAYPRELSKVQFTPGNDPESDMPAPLLFTLNFALFGCVCVPAIIVALAFRGGLVLLMTGVTFVRQNGAPASRMRLFWRALVTWSVLLIACALGWYSYGGGRSF